MSEAGKGIGVREKGKGVMGLGGKDTRAAWDVRWRGSLSCKGRRGVKGQG